MLFFVVSMKRTQLPAGGEEMADKNYGLIDLHLHLDGSLSVRSVRELAGMQGIEVAESDEELKKLLQVCGVTVC